VHAADSLISRKGESVRGVIASLGALVAASIIPSLSVAEPDDSPSYHLAREVAVPGDEGWDYLAFDGAGHRLFVTHGTHVQVLSPDLTLAGEIPDTPGVHGVALAPDLGRGYISAGRAGTVVVFDLKTLARIGEIKVTGENPDAILYEPSTHRVFTFNGRGRNATAIDAKTNKVVGTLALDAKPEFAVSDGAGHVFVNLEDRSSIARIDPKKLTVEAVWPLAGCEEPSGLAIDTAAHRLFAVCSNQVMAVVDAKQGRVITTLPIGARVDAAAFDPKTHLAFASCGDGTLTVVKEEAPGKFTVVQSAATRPGARTLALDANTHRVFLVTARLTPPPAPSPSQPRPRPGIEPGSFSVLVMEP
jgi:DNA-binding beta-propeller fold protein YncE